MLNYRMSREKCQNNDKHSIYDFFIIYTHRLNHIFMYNKKLQGL